MAQQIQRVVIIGNITHHLFHKSLSTISKESTLQVCGNGNGLPLTHNGEGEEIV